MKLSIKNSNYFYTDKLFGKYYSFTPKPDEVMIKFSEKLKSQQKTTVNTVVEQFSLELLHDAVESHNVGVYRIPSSSSLKTTISNLKTGEVYKTDDEWKAKGVPEEEIRRDVKVIMPSLDLFPKTK